MNKCECGAILIFDRQIRILDEYNDKFMVCNRYECEECGNEYEINEEIERTELFVKTHKLAFEHWEEGEVVKFWHDENNILCIKYKSGNWWHYRLNNYNEIEWW